MDFYKALSKSGKKPQSMMKIVIGFSVALLVMWLFMVSRMDTTTVAQSSEPEVQERTMGLQESLRASKTGTDSVKAAQASGQVEKKEAPDLFQNAFITFMVLIVSLGGLWFWAKKKGQGANASESKSRELDAHSLGENSQLKFLEINEEIWVVGMSENGINLLHRYPKAEWKERLPEDETEISASRNGSGNGAMKGDFKSFLKLVSS